MTCKNCGKTRNWVGYKTGIGKTPQQLEQMKKDATICAFCGYDQNNSELDHESETGKALDEVYGAIFGGPKE